MPANLFKLKEGTYLVPLDNLGEVLVAVWVFVICPHKDAVLAGGHRKGPNAGHDVGHDLAGLEHGRDALVLGAELGVPVDFGVVKLEDAAGFADFDVEVVGPGQDLVGKGAELALGADVVDLVDDCADAGVLVDYDFGNDVFVGEVLIPQVEMG